MFAHGLALMREDAQVGAWKGAAQEHEPSGLVLRVDPASFGLVDFPFQDPGGASRTPPLQAHEGQVQAGDIGRVEQILIVPHWNLDLVFARDERHLVRRHLLLPFPTGLQKKSQD
jgi:hypothetical protein